MTARKDLERARAFLREGVAAQWPGDDHDVESLAELLAEIRLDERSVSSKRVSEWQAEAQRFMLERDKVLTEIKRLARERKVATAALTHIRHLKWENCDYCAEVLEDWDRVRGPVDGDYDEEYSTDDLTRIVQEWFGDSKAHLTEDTCQVFVDLLEDMVKEGEILGRSRRIAELEAQLGASLPVDVWRLVQEARTQEREACALVAQRYVEVTGIELKPIATPTMAVASCAEEVAATIRARGTR